VYRALSLGAKRLRQLRDEQRMPLHSSVATKLVYPDHPFSPDLCRKITTFSPSFREMALSRKLSVQVIDHLYLVVTLGRSDIASNTLDLLGYSYETTMERMLAITLGTYTIYMRRHLTNDSTSPMLLIYLQL